MKLAAYYLRQVLSSFFVSSGSLFLVALPGMTVSSFSKLGGVGLSTALLFIPLVFGELGPFLLPIAFLLSVMVTYSRAAEDNEWVAIAAAGIRPARILMPTLALAGILAGGHYYLVARVAPRMKVAQKVYLHEAVMREARNLQPGRTELDFGPVHLSAQGRTGDQFQGVLLYWNGENEARWRFILADTAKFEVLGGTLRGTFSNALAVTAEDRVRVETLQVNLGAEELGGSRGTFKMKNQYLESHQLRRRISSGELQGKEFRVAVHEWHRRMAMSLSYVLFALLGAPSGIRHAKRGISGAFLATAGYGLTYYTLSLNVFRELAHSGKIDPAWGAWASLAIMLPPALWLSRARLAPRR